MRNEGSVSDVRPLKTFGCRSDILNVPGQGPPGVLDLIHRPLSTLGSLPKLLPDWNIILAEHK